MITGIVQTTRVNDYGYTSYKISSTWYGADSKGPPQVFGHESYIQVITTEEINT